MFRCGGNGKPKGWGVRCLDDVKPGQFLGAYLGEVLQVSVTVIPVTFITVTGKH